jgi:hypothetical protein
MAHVARFFERSCITGRGIYSFWHTVHQLHLLLRLKDRKVTNEGATVDCIKTNKRTRSMNAILLQSSHRHVSATLVAIFRVV